MCTSDMPRIHVTMIHVHEITVSRVTGYVSHGVSSVCTLMFSLTSLYVIDEREYTMRCSNMAISSTRVLNIGITKVLNIMI